MQAGLVYGYIDKPNIVKKMIEESGIEGIKVISTGGFGRMMAKETKIIDINNPNLSLEGLRIIYNKNIESSDKI